MDVQIAAQEQVESAVEILLGGLEMPGLVVVLSCLVFLFYLRDEVGHGVGPGLRLAFGLG